MQSFSRHPRRYSLSSSGEPGDTFHPTHCTVADAVAYTKRLRPKAAYLTHMSHDLGHAATSAKLPPGVFLSYDGLKLEVAL